MFVASMRLGTEPAAPHAVVDNRLSSTAPLEAQVATLVQNLSRDKNSDDATIIYWHHPVG